MNLNDITVKPTYTSESLPFECLECELLGDKEEGMVLSEDGHDTETQGGGVDARQTGATLGQLALHDAQLLQ